MNTVVRLMTLIFLLLSGPSGLASEKITIMVGGIDKQIYLPAMLAERLGYLKETGLEIELLSTSAGSSAEREMLSGVAHGVIGFYDRTINLQARGNWCSRWCSSPRPRAKSCWSPKRKPGRSNPRPISAARRWA
jgi:ABC-type nitrate/sulfonate/bicarbonate transport systems, periplasmic components